MMMEPQVKHPFDRVFGESAKANRAFRDYALMGESRSLHALHERYKALYEAWKNDPINNNKPPTRSFSTISDWSKKYAWRERVAAWEQIVREEEKAAARKEAEEWRERRRQVIAVGFAKVVEALNALDVNTPQTRPRLGEAIAALKGIVAELRVEYGETEHQRAAGIVGAAGAPVPPVVFVLSGDDGKQKIEPLQPEWTEQSNTEQSNDDGDDAGGLIEGSDAV